MIEFYSKLMGIWSEPQNYAKMPHCTYGKCACGVGNKIVKMIEEEKMHQFLMGLGDEYFLTNQSQVLDTIFNMVHKKNITKGSY